MHIGLGANLRAFEVTSLPVVGLRQGDGADVRQGGADVRQGGADLRQGGAD